MTDRPFLLSRQGARRSVDAGMPSAFRISLRAFLENPLAVGSAFPATRWLVERALAPLAWSRMRLVVEFGPGTGCFTKAMLARLSPQARLVAFETSGIFATYLRDTIADPRLRIVQAGAQDVRAVLKDHGPVDCIVSGLPFSTLPPGDGTQIVGASRAVLGTGGTFVAYQMRRDVEPLLAGNFAEVTTTREWRNVPPCRIYWAR